MSSTDNGLLPLNFRGPPVEKQSVSGQNWQLESQDSGSVVGAAELFLGKRRSSRVSSVFWSCVNTCCGVPKAAHMLESLIWYEMQVCGLRQSRLFAPVNSGDWCRWEATVGESQRQHSGLWMHRIVWNRIRRSGRMRSEDWALQRRIQGWLVKNGREMMREGAIVAWLRYLPGVLREVTRTSIRIELRF
jgi:hypothetical protein